MSREARHFDFYFTSVYSKKCARNALHEYEMCISFLFFFFSCSKLSGILDRLTSMKDKNDIPFCFTYDYYCSLFTYCLSLYKQEMLCVLDSFSLLRQLTFSSFSSSIFLFRSLMGHYIS